MPFKINISEKSGKTYHLEVEGETLMEKKLHEKVEGKDVSGDLNGYEFEITGASDNAGFTAMKDVEGIGLKKVLLTYGKGMHKKPKGEGKKNFKPAGLRLRKTVRGNLVSPAISQINLKVLKKGEKELSDIFPDQCKSKVEEGKTEEGNNETNAVKEEVKNETPEKTNEEVKVKEKIEQKKEIVEDKKEAVKEEKSEETKEQPPEVKEKTNSE